jgi:hypothetical protein
MHPECIRKTVDDKPQEKRKEDDRRATHVKRHFQQYIKIDERSNDPKQVHVIDHKRLKQYKNNKIDTFTQPSVHNLLIFYFEWRRGAPRLYIIRNSS